MRFNFDFSEQSNEDRPALTCPSSSSTPKQEIEWLPLQHHPVFNNGSATTSPVSELSHGDSNRRMPTNLMAWDGASRLYFWDQNKQGLHRISIRLGEPEPPFVLAAFPSKVLQADVKLSFVVNKVSINKNGSAIVLGGLEGISVMYLYGRSFMRENIIICRTVSVGSEIYSNGNNVVRTLQISWHTYSDTHLGVLSADSVFRLFDLSSALEQPEQEYYLQPVDPGRSRNAASICPVDFSFGGDHLWDRFSVFILFSDGSIYILCPVVPFGSVYKWESIFELYSDAHTFGMKSSNSKAVSNSNMAISWLESIFPELTHLATEGGNSSALKVQPYALYDASLLLQGPLHKVCHGGQEDSKVQVAECEGHAVSLLYNSISKDSILVTAWSGGQLQIDALADELQPLWAIGSLPRLSVDSSGHILGVAMICESVPSDLSTMRFDQPLNYTIWLGDPPLLFRLAIVDLALPRNRERGSAISMFVDPLIQERIYSLHDGGLDSIVLHFLPFTSQTSGRDKAMRTPSVHPVITTCPGESPSISPLCGFVALSDSYGHSWIVGLITSNECIVLDMETWNVLLPLSIDKEKKHLSLEEQKKTDSPTIISNDLLSGPKTVVLPPSSPNLRSVFADSIEGRSTLHQYFKLFHENYVEYAHKVYFELKHHGPRLRKIIDDQHSCLQEAKKKLLKVEENQEKIDDRINRAVQLHSLLEERLQILRNLPGLQKKPLTKAEQEFKLELDRLSEVELDALHSSIEAVNARLKRYIHSQQHNISNPQRNASGRRKNYVQDDEISQLKSSIAKLSLVNSENTKKVKLVEVTLRNRESSSS